tara:strand:+ start:2067 stop:2558 length:492 start_codon:yes stop_codon:yes gene_type:complete
MNLEVALRTFVDIEASGLDQTNSYPIEIGWSDTLGNQDNFLIKPLASWSYWDPNAQLIHSISREELLSDGLSVKEAAMRLNSSLGGETVYCDALDFDGFWLKRLFKAAEMEMTFTLVDVFNLYAEMSKEEFLIMQRYLNDNPASHRALADAERYSAAFRKAVN